MASAFAHGLLGYTLARAWVRRAPPRWFAPLMAISAILPDVDVLAFKLHIPYESPLGHRGLTHSLLFALVWSALLVALLDRGAWRRLLPAFFLATLSHGVLDAMTSGGLGVGFFVPFSNERFFLPWRPILVSPIGVTRFFSPWGLAVLGSEIVWVGLPCVALLGMLRSRAVPPVEPG